MRSRTTSTPAAPIATSVVAARHGRPNESVTMTPTSALVRSRRCSRSRAAEASGSSGSKTTVSGSGAFEASTPAEAQTKPGRVSAITSGARVRRIRALSRRITSSRRGSSFAARSRAWAEGSTSASRTTRPSALETTLCATTTTSPSSRSAAAAISSARSSPSRTSGSPLTGITRSSPPGLCNRLLLTGNAGELQPGVSPVLLVDVQDHRGHRLERPRVGERAGVESPAADESARELERGLLRALVVAADQRVLIRQLVRGEIDRGDRLQARGDRGLDRLGELLGQRPLVTGGQDAMLGEDDVACDAEHRRRPDRHVQLAGRVDRGVRLDGEDDEAGALEDLLVAAAADAELDPPFPAPLMLARANRDAETEATEPRGKRTPEGAGAAEDRDFHAGTSPRTVSTSACLASGSDISVRVTTGRTPRSATAAASSASAS